MLLIEKINYRPVYIYGLYAGDDSENIRYVGKTHYKLSKRLNEHIGEAKRKVENCPNTHKINWINKTIKNEKSVNIILLEETNEINWEKIEIAWIKKLKNNLTNSTKGGEGGATSSYTLTYEEVKKWVQKNFPNIKTKTQWFDFVKENEFPSFITKYPRIVYLNRGWVSWGDFFGTGKIQDNKMAENYISYNEAKKWIKINLKNAKSLTLC